MTAVQQGRYARQSSQ